MLKLLKNEEISREAKQAELDSLTHSGLVREHTQLSNLLGYLGRKSLESPGEPLKEYTIGVEALNKPQEYDPRLDPTVRVEVGKLRKKLKEFYQERGGDHPVKLVIPNGGYLPVYARNRPFSYRDPKGGWIAAAALLVILTGFLVASAHRSRPALNPELSAFWAPHLAGSVPTLLVYGTPLFVKIEDSFYRDPDVNAAADMAGHEDLQRVIGALKPRETRALYKYTGFGEAESLFLLTRLLAAQGASVSAQRSNAVSPDDIKGRHVILLGSRKFNPQFHEIQHPAKFEAAEGSIVNLRPKSGEPAEYRTVRKSPYGEITEEYSLISVYPGISPGTRLIALECFSTEGTLAAAEFLTRPDTIAELLKRKIPLAKAGHSFPAFQVVVGAKVNQGVVVSLFYVTHAVLS